MNLRQWLKLQENSEVTGGNLDNKFDWSRVIEDSDFPDLVESFEREPARVYNELALERESKMRLNLM